MKLTSDALKCFLAVAGAAQLTLADGGKGLGKIPFSKLHGKSFESAKASDSGDGKVDLTNENTYYSVNIRLGNPEQEMPVVLDTGSSDLWVPGKGGFHCQSGSSDDDAEKDAGIASQLASIATSEGGPTPSVTATSIGSASKANPEPFGPTNSSALPPPGAGAGAEQVSCPNAPTAFDPDSSKTLNKNDTADGFSIVYGDNSYAKGYWATDDIKIGDFDVKDLSFALATDYNSSSPVFGISYRGLESSIFGDADLSDPHEYENFPYLLKDQGIVKRNAYSLYLNSPSASDGNILFGGVDHDKYKNGLYTVPVVQLHNDDDPWERFVVTVQGVGIKGGEQKTLTTTKFLGLLDSGTTAVYLPESVADMISKHYGGFFDDDPSVDSYVIPCPSDDEKLVFNFGGFNIETSLSNYIQGSGDGKCILGVVPTNDYMAILGDFFLRDAYVVYDLEGNEISLAQADFNSSENIEVITDSVPGATKAPGYSQTYTGPQSFQTGGNIFG